MIPSSRRASCETCGAELDTRDRNTYRFGSAWFKNRPTKLGGMNTATLAVYTNRYACRWCIEGKRKGIPEGQLRLFDPQEG